MQPFGTNFPTELSAQRSKSALDEDTSASDVARSLWNQIKFGWDVRIWPHFKANEVIHFVGCKYIKQSESGALENDSDISGDLEKFASDFYSRIWFSYRENFAAIPIISKPADRVKEAIVCNEPRDDCSTSFDSLSSNEAPNKQYDDDPAVSTSNSSSGVDRFRSQFRDWKNSVEQWHREVIRGGFFSTFNHTKLTRRRSGSPAISKCVRTSDCGWGCMLRAGQMMLAHIFVLHFLGREWRYNSEKKFSDADSLHRQIIRLFGDSLSPNCPFSVHRFVQASGKNPGDWFGPSTLCSTVLKLVASSTNLEKRLTHLEFYLARDRIIYRQEVMSLARGEHPVSHSTRNAFTDHTANHRQMCNGNEPESASSECSGINHAVVLLIPLMLGAGKHIGSMYIPLLKRLLADPACVGLIGGRPKHSIYAAGFQAERLVCLDPHLCQETVDVDKPDFSLHSWHCPVPKTVRIRRLDPCCAVGFYCRSRGDLVDLLDRLPKLATITDTGHVGTNHRISSQAIIEVV